MTPLLEVRDLGVRFGGVVAVAGVSLDVGAGELVGVIGPNGAGKTTVLDALSGFVRHDGSVAIGGVRMDGRRPDQRAARGLARTFQSLELFEDLTVRENVAAGARARAAAEATMAAYDLTDVGDRLPEALSGSQRRFVALARAVAGAPRVLLLDEVAAGMDLDERAVLARHLGELASAGTGILLVDHDLGLVARACHRIVVLDGGRVIATGPSDGVRRDGRVKAAYLGRT